MFNVSGRVSYQNVVEGTVGTFQSPAGEVCFLQTKARLSVGDTDNESRLTSQLAPVREVLKMERMNFNQLLQRDLDDHRVSTQLIPYLLEPKESGPAFFPPILAMLLPFKGPDPQDHFPARSDLGAKQDDGMWFLETRYGTACRHQRLCGENGDLSAISFGRLSWNSEQAKLVVIDGQHRAMALIAIYRTLNDAWRSSTGARYSHFYEHRVQELLRLLKAQGKEPRLDKVEFPVTVCWFPESGPHAPSPHRGARKLFVDVNQNARQPSKARLVLLSDTELVNVFTRSLLNRLRTEDGANFFPLYAIEYDNPDEEISRPVRWSVAANLDMLRAAVDFTVFGPTKYINNMSQRMGGRPADKERDLFMRSQLQLKEFLPDPLEDEGRQIPLDQLGNRQFPLRYMDIMVDRFQETWGDAILTLLSRTLPYKSHIESLVEFAQGRVRDDSAASLAYDALFEGVGMYWTLRDSDAHYKDLSRRCRDEQKPVPPQPEIVKAWRVIEEMWKQEFSAARAHRYLGRKDEESRRQSEELFDITNTHACFVGLVLTLATLVHDNDVARSEIPKLAHQVSDALNAAILAGPGRKDRRAIFIRSIPEALNRIPKMDAPLAIYFRYFWLELLATDESKERLENVVAWDKLAERRDEARAAYYEYLVGERRKALNQTMLGSTEAEILEKARDGVRTELWKSLHQWFKVYREAFEAWAEARLKGGSSRRNARRSAGQGDDDEEPDAE